MINRYEVFETNNMVEHENLDVRTITIGISLLECIDSDLDKLNENVPGVQYFGPAPNSLPLIEYETQIDIVKLNRYTYVNQITFNPLPIKYNGTMFYYLFIKKIER